MAIDPRIAPYLGRVLDADGSPAGTCFQVTSGVLVTAWHVLDDLGAGSEGAVVRVDPPQGGGPARDAAAGLLASLASDGTDPAGALSTYQHALDFAGQVYGTDHPLTQAIHEAIRNASDTKAG
jgi:hypothetical protein